MSRIRFVRITIMWGHQRNGHGTQSVIIPTTEKKKEEESLF